MTQGGRAPANEASWLSGGSMTAQLGPHLGHLTGNGGLGSPGSSAGSGWGPASPARPGSISGPSAGQGGRGVGGPPLVTASEVAPEAVSGCVGGLAALVGLARDDAGRMDVAALGMVRRCVPVHMLTDWPSEHARARMRAHTRTQTTLHMAALLGRPVRWLASSIAFLHASYGPCQVCCRVIVHHHMWHMKISKQPQGHNTTQPGTFGQIQHTPSSSNHAHPKQRIKGGDTQRPCPHDLLVVIAAWHATGALKPFFPLSLPPSMATSDDAACRCVELLGDTAGGRCPEVAAAAALLLAELVTTTQRAKDDFMAMPDGPQVRTSPLGVLSACLGMCGGLHMIFALWLVVVVVVVTDVVDGGWRARRAALEHPTAATAGRPQRMPRLHASIQSLRPCRRPRPCPAHQVVVYATEGSADGACEAALVRVLALLAVGSEANKDAIRWAGDRLGVWEARRRKCAPPSSALHTHASTARLPYRPAGRGIGMWPP